LFFRKTAKENFNGTLQIDMTPPCLYTGKGRGVTVIGRKMKGGNRQVEPEAFAGIYAEIAAQIDCETAVRLFELLRGQMVIFPQKLYNSDYVRSYIRLHRADTSVRELARKFGYSDRRIRQLIAEERENTAEE